jgi:hypothetical protein
MNETTKQLCDDHYKKMETTLNQISCDHQDQLARAIAAVPLLEGFIAQLGEKMKRTIGNEVAEEIAFNKFERPRFVMQLLYHQKLVILLSSEPVASRKQQMRYFKQAKKNIAQFGIDNREFIEYYRSGQTHLDEAYFTNKIWATQPTCMHPPNKWAEFLALGRLNDFLDAEIKKLKGNNSSNGQLVWTAPKTGLIELMYALHTSAAIDEGRSDLKQLAQTLEQTFQISLGNYSRVFQDIRLRKNGQSAFLDQLKMNFMKRVKEME